MKKQSKETRIKSIIDLVPARAHGRVMGLPMGKPMQTSTWQYGPASIKTYIYKSGEVYLRLKFHDKELYYKKNPVIVDDMGNLIKS